MRFRKGLSESPEIASTTIASFLVMGVLLASMIVVQDAATGTGESANVRGTVSDIYEDIQTACEDSSKRPGGDLDLSTDRDAPKLTVASESSNPDSCTRASAAGKKFCYRGSVYGSGDLGACQSIQRNCELSGNTDYYVEKSGDEAVIECQ